ncbi:hypothetical protein JCM11641_003078 [Rhodosporidiobolus odoratus]
MPFLNLPSAVRMHYEVLSLSTSTTSHSIHATAAWLDPSRPTLVVLVPFFVTHASALCQLGPTSPLLRSHNVLAFSPRAHGRTTSEPKAHDAFASAADLAFAFEALQLPPSQLYAPGSICGRIALAFAAMFPSQVTALALCGVGSGARLAGPEAWATLESTLFNPPEEQDLHEVVGELALQSLGYNADTDSIDELTNIFVRRYNPRHAVSAYTLCRLVYLSMPLTAEAAALIKAPVLLLHGEDDVFCPPSDPARWTQVLVNAEAVEMHVIPGAPHVCYHTHNDDVLPRLTSFLSRHAPSSSPSPIPLDLTAALRTCSSITGNPKVLLRNSRCPESYSVLPDAEREEATRDLARMQQYEAEWAKRPLVRGAEGLEPWEAAKTERVARPTWRWSRRHEFPSASPRSSSRFSCANEVIVQIDSVRRTSRADEAVALPLSTVDKVLSPRLGRTASATSSFRNYDGESSDDESDGESCRGRKDSGYGEFDDFDMAKQDGVVESMSRLALQQAYASS